MLELIKQPWPWYVAGPLIGLMVPILLIGGNKLFGISSSLRHICAACIPTKIPFFKYEWKRESWNLVLVAGIVLGSFIASQWLMHDDPMRLNPNLVQELSSYGITDLSAQAPVQIFNFQALSTVKGLLLIVAGGLLVGFGTRYAGGCTSGHSIMGLSNLQLPSLIATVCFMVGGFIMSNLVLPLILTL